MPSFSASHTASCAALSRGGGLQHHMAPCTPGLSMSSAVSAMYCGQVSPKIFSALLLRLTQRLDRLDLRHVHDQQRRIDQARQRDRAVGRLGLGDACMGDGVELRRAMALLDQVMRQPLDHVVVLGMHHDQRAVLAGERQDVEHLVVAHLHGVVGHVDLERGVAVADQRRQVLAQRLRRGIGDDQVEGVVDHGLGRAPPRDSPSPPGAATCRDAGRRTGSPSSCRRTRPTRCPNRNRRRT